MQGPLALSKSGVISGQNKCLRGVWQYVKNKNETR